MKRCWAAWMTGLTALLLGATPAAAETWALLDLGTRGVDETSAATFRDLLQGELGDVIAATFVQPSTSCDGSECAADVGAEVGADYAVFGSLSALGAKIIVNLYTVDVRSGEVTTRHKMTVDRVEDLDAVATRIAKAIAGGRSVEETAALGSITHEEAKPDLRREGQSGVGLWLGGVLPVGEAFSGGAGINIDLSYWFETRHFAIEPRIGFRFAADPEEGQSWFELPMDVGLFYIPMLGDFTPFFGGGMGVRYVDESRFIDETTGTTIPVSSRGTVDDSGWGFGLYGKVGVLALRTYAVRVAVAIEYGAAFVDLHGRTPNHLNFTVGVFF